MKKYLRLTCTNCKRDIDKLIDLTHYTPDQCTITLGCEGRLRPVEFRSSGGIAVKPEIGVTDWRPRGSVITENSPLKAAEFIALETGTLKQIVLAVPMAAEPASNSTYTLTLDVKADAPKAFRQYVFRKEGAFSTVSGVESGLEKKTLRYTATGSNPDVVEVFVNGVERELGVDFIVYDGTANGGVPNTITFTTPINLPGMVQIDVIVSKQATSTELNLVFKRNKSDEARLPTGAFENVSSVKKLGNAETFYLFTLDLDSAAIPLNSILIAKNPGLEFFMLARQPYTQLDRYFDLIVPLEGLTVDRDYLKFYAIDDVTTLRATTSSVASIYPRLTLTKFNVEKTIKTATAGVEEQLVIDGRVIVGPDA